MRIFLLLGSMLLAIPAFAEPYQQVGSCGSGGAPALHRVEVTGGSPDTTFYFDDENYFTGNGTWVFQESNTLWVQKLPGVYLEGLSNANLQRGGSSILIGADSDICSDADDIMTPDQMLL